MKCNVCDGPMPAGKGGNCPKCREVRTRLSELHKQEGPNWKAYRAIKSPLIERYAALAAIGAPLTGSQT